MSNASASSVSPARRQYLEFKQQFPDAILMYQVGDFYETFDEDAYIASRELQIVRTTRSYSKGKERVPLAGIPMHALDNYVGKLIQRGYKVVIVDQVSSEVPKGRDVVDRVVSRILTAGTLSEPDLLPTRQNNYLVAIAAGRTQTGLAAVDVSTGEFMVTWFELDELPVALDAELQRLAPVECLLPEGANRDLYQFPSKTLTVTHCAPTFFQPETAQARLCKHFNVQTLAAYGCANHPQAIAAAGAILTYIEKMNVALLSLLTGLRSYQTTSYMLLDAHTQRNLELLQGTRSGTIYGSLLAVLDRSITPMGARQMRRTLTQPLLDLNELDARLTAVEELYESPALRNRFTAVLQELGDLERVAARIRQGTAVRNEVIGMRDYLGILPQIRELLQGCNAFLLQELAHELTTCPQVMELIDRALMRAGEEDEHGDDSRLIRPGYNNELDDLFDAIRDSRRWMVSLEARERQRTGIKSLKVGFNKVFGYYIEVSHANAKLVPDDYQRKQTLVNAERFITPELKEHEARILSAFERIEEMEQNLYADLLRQIAIFYSDLITTASAIARLDVLLALADLAARQGYIRPVLEQGHTLEIVAGRHPVVEYSLDGDVFIPNDTHLEADEGERVLLLTGPNMAGKSTYLRQVALITLLAQIGSFVPARQARIGLVDRIFTRVGAEDDIASGKSTFMVEMEETATILHHATSHSLIILDEIGRGTSTYDGLAIARSVVEYLHNKLKSRTLFATHYHELAEMADELAHLGVYTMAISEDEAQKIVFLHRVTPGSTGRSYGVHVARLAGMPLDVIQRAEAVLEQLESHTSTALHHKTEQVTELDPVLSYSQALSVAPVNPNLIAESNGHYHTVISDPDLIADHDPVVPSKISRRTKKRGRRGNSDYDGFVWQSEEAQIAALTLEHYTDDEEINLDDVNLYAITPLDALNLLFMLQKKRKMNSK